MVTDIDYLSEKVSRQNSLHAEAPLLLSWHHGAGRLYATAARPIQECKIDPRRLVEVLQKKPSRKSNAGVTPLSSDANEPQMLPISEDQLQPELYAASRRARRDGAEISPRHRYVRVVELGMIEDVESLAAKGKDFGFAEDEIFNQRHVPVVPSRTANDARSTIAVPVGRRRYEHASRTRIEVKVPCARLSVAPHERNHISGIKIVRGADAIRPACPSGSGDGRRQPGTTLKLVDARELPATESFFMKAFTVTSERQFINIVDRKNMVAIKVRMGFLGPEVINVFSVGTGSWPTIPRLHEVAILPFRSARASN